MQSTIIRKIDFQGRVTIPKQFTSALFIEPEDELALTMNGNTIQMATMKNHCVFCGNEATTLFNNKPICQDCIAKIKNN